VVVREGDCIFGSTHVSPWSVYLGDGEGVWFRGTAIIESRKRGDGPARGPGG
jgi:hypothetical protein